MSDDVEQNESVAPSIDDATEAFDTRSEAEIQRDEYLDALQRLQADFENYRKRVSRSSEDAATRAAGDLVSKVLPVIDAFDYALAHFGNVESPEAVALAQARGLLLDTLHREGLERIDNVGAPFDPQIEDAVAHSEGDDESDGPMVEEVLRAGYRWKGVVLRPAMVKVRG
ncbi:MAG TPA: nucleotide exchange factor GrpE [Acidimicrobiales bacterium]|nr:nucleotide exchange factor GrpE [Acidimicrobiales bacterium]